METLPLQAHIDETAPAVMKAREAGVDFSRLPQHIAIIMDGNGRWALQRGLPRLVGHRQGYRTVRRVVKDCADLGVKMVTLYTFSTENWRRPPDETSGLMALIEEAARQELRQMVINGIQVRVIGRMHELPTSLQEELRRGIEITARNNRLILNLAINYGGRAEIVDAVRAIARRVRQGELQPEEIDESTIRAHLYAPDMPDPDLLIRTAGEMRVSNFLVWQTAYSELWVTPTLWPDFRTEHLIEAILSYQQRVRKFGGILDEE
ncbi:Ditrans,polycis-undecaprenyl-diphosphate synthase ((2E,6E)-farnesyl-diphosphate specific) [bacterium HR16]|nr:Ditrans,polycis-undecaprenyl-diphosphate synthase ((2E,6E)-farnesyl-diphosphate specific) [bacterium HR16]